MIFLSFYVKSDWFACFLPVSVLNSVKYGCAQNSLSVLLEYFGDAVKLFWLNLFQSTICCIFANILYVHCRFNDMNEKSSILFLVNPKSGVQSKADLPRLIEKFIDKRKFDYAIKHTQYVAHACELAREAVSQKVNVVVAVGGDGTVNEVGRVLVGTDTALGILPFGSGNGLARHLGVPIEPKGALEFINRAVPVNVDYGKINGTPFFCTCGIGFDALVSHSFAQGKRRGPLGYINNMLLDWLQYEPEIYELETEWSSEKYKAFLIACGNAAQYGNNAYIAPGASMRDGMLSITIMEPFGVVDVPMILGQMLGKNLYSNSKIRTLAARWVKIKRSRPGVVHFDGEPAEMAAEVYVEIVPSGLKVLAEPDWDGCCADVSLFKQAVEMLRGSVASINPLTTGMPFKYVLPSKDALLLKKVLPFKDKFPRKGGKL